MNYYWYNRQYLLQKAKEKYHDYGGKEKAAEYYLQNKDFIKEKSNKYKNLSEEEKEAKRKYNKDRYEKMKKKLS